MSQEIPLTFTEEKEALAVEKRNFLRLLLTAMRPHQWVKNLFIFAPLLFGRKLFEVSAVINSLSAFAIFCLLSSGLYIFNDVVDAEEDRAHPKKRFRPVSSGALSVPAALFSAALLVGVAFAAAFAINLNLFLISALYFALTIAYCLFLKRMILLDGMTIAAGFVLRIIGGAVVVDVMPTHWLIVCAFLLALFLAFTKRRQELLVLSETAADHREVLNEYSIGYLDQVNNILIGAAIVCYALYTVAPETVERFGTTGLIYGTVFVIYGMLRYMALIKNPENGGNPSKMLVRDKPLLAAVAGWAVYNSIVIYHISLKSLWFPQ
jgi:4-hydroxybenzoate polyprenyltransferase